MHPRVQQALEAARIEYKLIRHADSPTPIRSPQDFADYLGYGLGRITKTLFCRSTRRDIYALAVAPMTAKINFAIMADALESPRFEVADREELKSKLGFPPHGVSPIGAVLFPTFIEESLMKYPTVLVGSGMIGAEIELAPGDLVKICSARVTTLAA